ncbi:DUF6415 family natural product biosynthesis protein [Streptomyces angustmyceticus]|uniref:DUF6415 family natural product biosynthesis protein n=1 Tax=Streptomyces angustmyceticus TaxID=285578 RepID=UPI0021B05315|nr:DUF6415 family natural product biosynthesis protein [Streptomyces angustmyceticus]
MNSAVTALKSTERHVPAWTPPLDAEELRSVLARVTTWKPLDVKAIFDDLDTAIGNQTPSVATIADLVERLRGYLKQLSDIAVADPTCPPTKEMVRHIERGRPMRDERLPADRRQAVGLARRLAFVTSDLVEELIEAGYIKSDE